MQTEKLLELTIAALEDMKAENIVTLDVTGMTSIADYLVICSARSTRHLKAVADNVWVKVKSELGHEIKINGDNNSGWVVVDLGDIVVHIMSKEEREFYALEKLWHRQ